MTRGAKRWQQLLGAERHHCSLEEKRQWCLLGEKRWKWQLLGKAVMTVVGKGGDGSCWDDDQRSDRTVVVPNKR